MTKLLSSGNKSFYATERGKVSCFDLASGSLKLIEDAPGVIILAARKQAAGVVEENTGAPAGERAPKLLEEA